jgi:hypothetical protein
MPGDPLVAELGPALAHTIEAALGTSLGEELSLGNGLCASLGTCFLSSDSNSLERSKVSRWAMQFAAIL